MHLKCKLNTTPANGTSAADYTPCRATTVHFTTVCNRSSMLFPRLDLGFGHSVMIVDKHLSDFSCLGTHRLVESEKLSNTIFAHWTSGQILHYLNCGFSPLLSSPCFFLHPVRT